MLPTRIFMTGFMGTGKSTIGRLVADQLDYSTVDVDTLIVETVGCPITEIFSEEGEAAFRQYEHQALADACRGSECIVSLGGGALIEPENRPLIADAGVLIYLCATFDTIYERVSHRFHRPLLLDDNGNMISRELFEERARPLFEARRPGYESADIIIDVDAMEKEEVAGLVLAKLQTL
jgi:shikimate kinase